MLIFETIPLNTEQMIFARHQTCYTSATQVQLKVLYMDDAKNHNIGGHCDTMHADMPRLKGWNAGHMNEAAHTQWGGRQFYTNK